MAAALDVFLDQGFHGASLDKIAAAAGYTKGVVYSRFASKADLFLALLDDRITQRADDNARAVRGLQGVDGLERLARRLAEQQRQEQAWTLLVLEFRVHAARSPELSARYAELHQRTLDRLATAVRAVLGDGGPPARDRRVARALFAIGSGATLEQAVDPTAFGPADVTAVARALGEGLG